MHTSTLDSSLIMCSAHKHHTVCSAHNYLTVCSTHNYHTACSAHKHHTVCSAHNYHTACSAHNYLTVCSTHKHHTYFHHPVLQSSPSRINEQRCRLVPELLVYPSQLWGYTALFVADVRWLHWDRVYTIPPPLEPSWRIYLRTFRSLQHCVHCKQTGMVAVTAWSCGGLFPIVRPMQMCLFFPTFYVDVQWNLSTYEICLMWSPVGPV